MRQRRCRSSDRQSPFVLSSISASRPRFLAEVFVGNVPTPIFLPRRSSQTRTRYLPPTDFSISKVLPLKRLVVQTEGAGCSFAPVPLHPSTSGLLVFFRATSRH